MNASSKSGSGKTKSAKSLTHKLLENLTPDNVPYLIRDSRTTGLAVRVSVNGSKTWDCSFRICGTKKVRRVSLGAWPDRTLEEARNRANDLTRAARAGRDLIAEEEQARRQTDTRMTVKQLIDEYVRRRVHGQLRSATQIEDRLNRALKPLFDRPVVEIRRRDIRVLLDACADAGHTRETNQRRTTIATMFKWAVSVDIADANIAAGLPSYGKANARNRVLTATEIPLFWHWLETGGMPPRPSSGRTAVRAFCWRRPSCA